MAIEISLWGTFKMGAGLALGMVAVGLLLRSLEYVVERLLDFLSAKVVAHDVKEIAAKYEGKEFLLAINPYDPVRVYSLLQIPLEEREKMIQALKDAIRNYG